LAISVAVLGLFLVAVCAFNRNGCYAILGVTLIMIGAVIPAIQVAVGQGRSTLACTIHVVDAERGNPVAAANVRTRDIESHGHPDGVPLNPVPAGEPGVTGVTDASGVVTLGFEFRNSSRTGFLVDECQIYVSPYFWIQVDATDYETTLVRMDSFTGTSYDWNALPLPQMKVQVTPRRETPDR
jgi:hypothetical protein